MSPLTMLSSVGAGAWRLWRGVCDGSRGGVRDGPRGGVRDDPRGDVREGPRRGGGVTWAVQDVLQLQFAKVWE